MGSIQSDFYSYRYFASEGFLPGYNFPRLPISAFIPGRRQKQGRDEFLSRPRFLAISEFGPRAFVYHEGSRYMINRVILTVEGDEEPQTIRAKQCPACGYVHPPPGGETRDLCERCGGPLGAPMPGLFRLRNVSTKRREKINSDEEERQRSGYELKAGFRFAERNGDPSFRRAEIRSGEEMLGTLDYGAAATLWRINLGLRRRADPNRHGFVLDLDRGIWGREDQLSEDEDEDPMGPRTRRVIPYVEDRRNCLVFQPANLEGPGPFASLQAALKNAIQVCYQLEDGELAAERLPDPDGPALLLFYESSEGGAGVLKRLTADSRALAEVARKALELCHFDPEAGQDVRKPEGSSDPCEAACYFCLMSYGN
ncbi:MAG: Zn-binding domain-containing protein, partial [Vicinamibacteria bacterium]